MFIIDSSSFPLVSVIIPVYNVRPYLKECLDSVISQTYKNLEILIIDDGSTDGSEKICDRYKRIDDRVRVIHQKNRGLSGARNAGLDVMNGDFVAFLDSDDAYLPKMIDTMVKEIKNTSCDMAVCGYYVCNTTKYLVAAQHSGIFKLKRKVLSSEKALKYMINGTINVTVWNKLYKRSLFNKLRFAEGHIFEDKIIMPHLLECANSVLLIDQLLLLYRIRPCSITTAFNEDNRLEWLYARKLTEKFIAERTPSVFSKEERNKVLEKNFICLINDRLNLLSQFGSISQKEQKIFENELVNKLKYLRYYSFRTRVIYHIYKLCPYLCLCILNVNDYIVALLSKIKALLQRCFHE